MSRIRPSLSKYQPLPKTDTDADMDSDIIECTANLRKGNLMNVGHFCIPALIAAVLLAVHVTGAESSHETAFHLMPIPEHIAISRGRLPIDRTFGVHLSGHSDPRLVAAVVRMLDRLRRKTGIPLALSPAEDPDPGRSVFEIHCGGPGEKIQSVRENESYILNVSDRSARLAAPSTVGILRGLETFLQLIDLDSESFFIPAVEIEDRPRFPWRGLLIDVSRHWEPAEVIRRNLDAMAALKMNVFHWHLSDDQGFRVESRVFPELHRIGSEGKYYTQQEVREIVAYARDRGIRIVPEFDMPGHTTAWLAAYPQLASAPGPYQIERFWGVFDPCMDPTQKKLYSFLDAFIGEMAELFPDECFHIGGDEVNGKHWNASSDIRSFKARHNLKENRDLQAYFNKRLVKILAKHGKQMIGWDEVLHPNLPKSITVQSWRGQAALAESARRGHAGILSYGYYLDQMQPAGFHYGIDPLGKEAMDLTDEDKDRILGGEACMWGELVNPDNIESRIWPRTAAIAERLWSPAQVRDVPDMYRRLEYVNRELELSGLMHRANYIEMLQRMAGDREIAPLKTLADLLKPTKLGVRARTRKYSSLVPLNRLVDTVLPESDTARHFNELVDDALADPSGSSDAFQEIQTLMTLWRDHRTQIEPIIEHSFILEEIDPLSETVFELSTKGLQALGYIESRQRPPEAWRTEAALLLQQSEKPQAEMLVAIVPAIAKLVEAANEIH
jgi:hexosaminidase